MNVATISPRRLFEQYGDGVGTLDLLDVRTPVEFRVVHAVEARNVPLEQLDPAAEMGLRQGRREEPLFLICQSGSRGRQACEKFLAAGFTRVVNVEGGTQAWVKSGLPVFRDKTAISLERQVRIAAGLLVMVGTALGAFVHPGFLGLSGFIGAGLVFAGITDTCGMGMALARMPWNRSSTSSGRVSPAVVSR